jgi:hypothetical protein
MSEGGVTAAEAFKSAIDANGLLPGITTEFDMGDFATILNNFGTTLKDIINNSSIITSNAPFGSGGGGGGAGGGLGLNFADAQVMAYSKGGMVDETGVAMLHGSSTSPEAVLNPQQTQMFIGLRDALQGLAFESGNGSRVNIENIEIKTDSLNSNQDFVKAGETLANAFNSAIQRRGLIVNTKK